MAKHLMIDIEGMGLPTEKRLPLVYEIGLCAFDDTEDSFSPTMNMSYYPHIQEQLDKGSTVDVWNLRGLDDTDSPRLPPEANLNPLVYCRNQLRMHCLEVDYVWCLHELFDFAILERLFGTNTMWLYQQPQDFATVRYIINDVMGLDWKCEPAQPHVGHSDALAQAEFLFHALQRFKDIESLLGNQLKTPMPSKYTDIP